jgi:hypothetical protein
MRPTKDGVQGRAQLMGDNSEKLILQSIRGLGGGSRRIRLVRQLLRPHRGDDQLLIRVPELTQQRLPIKRSFTWRTARAPSRISA